MIGESIFRKFKTSCDSQNVEDPEKLVTIPFFPTIFHDLNKNKAAPLPSSFVSVKNGEGIATDTRSIRHFVGLWLCALDGSPLGFEDGPEVLGDPDGSVLGVAVGALLGTLAGMLLSAFAGLRLTH
jgi:hypothetical protein